MTAEWLQWYYLIYLLPAAVAVLLLLLSGLGGHGGAGHHAHGGVHFHTHHTGGHMHGSHDAAHTAASGHSHAHAADAGHAHASHGHGGDGRGPNAAQQILGFFGVGRAPITIVVGSMLIGWGFLGFATNESLRPILHSPALFMGPSLLVAAAGALLSGKLFGELAARLMPKDESYAITREGLLGLTGTVVYPVSESGGRVHVFDEYRTLHVVPARLAAGVAPIPKGGEIIIASMDADGCYVLVEPLGFKTARPATPQKLRTEEESVVEIRHQEGSR